MRVIFICSFVWFRVTICLFVLAWVSIVNLMFSFQSHSCVEHRTGVLEGHLFTDLVPGNKR